MQYNYSEFNLLNKKQKAQFILSQLKQDYPYIDTPLIHNNAFELLISVMLSPQTTDDVTNSITPTLFNTYKTPIDLKTADMEEVKKIIRPINFHKTKAERIVNAARLIDEEFDGKVPHTMEILTSIPGVGRKVANVIINDWYADSEISHAKKDKSSDYDAIKRGTIQPEGIVVDTHVLRISQALGLSSHKTADKVEKDLIELIPSFEWPSLSLRMIFHGREVFQAKKPQFESYPVWKDVYKSLGF